MKRNTVILIKTTSLVLAFMLFLGVGIMSLSFSHSGVKPNDSNFLTPEHAIAAPTAQELLQKKFDAYNTVTEEDGKSVVTIFSEEQIKDFNDRRNNGEWFWLSSEEMLYIINDTVKLFEEYDVVKIWNLEGAEREYPNFTLQTAIYEVIQERARVLNSATFVTLYSPEHNVINYHVWTDCQTKLTKAELQALDQAQNPWYGIPKEISPNLVLWAFGDGIIHYWHKDIWSQYDLHGGYYFWKARTQIFPKEQTQ